MIQPHTDSHKPVLLTDVLACLSPKDDEIYVDGTFGAGGYTRGILDAANCNVISIDRDPNVAAFADEVKSHYKSRFTFLAGTFGEMEALLAAHGITQVDGIVLDIGVSSMQIDQPERGFSFQNDGPLDMRMSQSGMSAADLVNQTDEKALADILFIYGEEKASRRIAKAIVEARAEKPIATTRELSSIIAKAIGKREKKDPATRTFQALRIYVNDELRQLEKALESAERLLKPGGRLVVVVFHSLEDRIVKNFFRERSGKTGNASRHLPEVAAKNAPTFHLLTPKGISAGEEEIRLNPRARSATLRACERTNAPSFHSHPGRH